MMPRSRNSAGRMSMFEEKMKASRRLADKDRFQQRIKDVHEFLLGLGFPGTINVKSLHTTAHEEFHVFYLFAQHLSGSSFQFPTNEVEEEIPKLLKDLGYPVALSNRLMYTVGHRQMQCLGGIWLHWLNDWIFNWHVVQMMCLVKEKESSSTCDVEEGAEFNEPLREYCCDTYRKFLEGADTIEEKDEALINKLLIRFNMDKQHFISQQKIHRMSMEKVETMERECQDRLNREGSRPQHNLEKQKFTLEDIERHNRESEEQRLTRCMDKMKQMMMSRPVFHTKLEENGAAGVEREGTKTQKSRGGKKVRRKGRK